MEASRERYVEEFGLLFERFGLARMVGRVLGVLLTSGPPERTAEELAEALGASRGSISTSTRSLERMGLIERRSRKGERRDYFRVKPGAWHETMRQRLQAVTMFREVAERGLEVVETGDPEARRGLEEMRDYFAFWEKELPGVVEKWEKETEGRETEEK